MNKLSKSGIIHKNKEFRVVYQKGKSYANKMAVLYVLPNRGGTRRVGFAAGKRLGCAPVRNRVKRLLRECYRLNQSRLKDGVDLLLVGRQAMVEAKLEAVTRAFLDLAKKSNIWVG